MDAGRVASYGVGAAALELWLLRSAPARHLFLTDYGPETVARLAELLPEATVLRHDLRTDEPLEADAHLFHRIDTELSNRPWRKIFRRFGRATVLFILGEIADFARIRLELKQRLLVRGLSRVGWLRNRPALESLWQQTHEAEPLHAHDLEGWVLRPRA